MKIGFFEIEEWEKPYLQQALPNTEVVFFEHALSPETMNDAKGFHIVSVFADSKITKEVIDVLQPGAMIATRSTGFDHIDIAYAAQKGITVCNVPTYGENTVAEHTFALILDLSRKIHQSIESVKREGFSAKGLTGFDLKDKTIGIVGLGHIGQHVARIANGFQMRVLVYDKLQDKKLAKKLGFYYATLEELLAQSDIITLHVPYNQHTHHLINIENISAIKKGAYLINTARGGLVQTEALVRALHEGILAGAALDVLEEECFIKEERQLLSAGFDAKCDLKTMLQNHVLMERENVIITPHNAFNSKEALERILETTVENVQEFLRNRPTNIVE